MAKPGKTLNFVFGFLNLKNSIRYARTYWPLEMRLFCGGGCRGGARAGSPLWLDQTEARRAQKKFLKDRPPPLSQGLDDRRPPPPPFPLSGVLDSPLFCTSYSYPGFYFFRLSTMATGSHGRHISFMPTTLPGSPAAATILTSPSSATGLGNFDSFTVIMTPVMFKQMKKLVKTGKEVETFHGHSCGYIKFYRKRGTSNHIFQKHFISVSLVPYSSCVLMGIYTQPLTR